MNSSTRAKPLELESPTAFIDGELRETEAVEHCEILGLVYIGGVVVDDPVDSTKQEPIGRGREESGHHRWQLRRISHKEVANVGPDQTGTASRERLVNLTNLEVAQRFVVCDEVEPRSQVSDGAPHLDSCQGVLLQILAARRQNNIRSLGTLKTSVGQELPYVWPTVRDSEAPQDGQRTIGVHVRRLPHPSALEHRIEQPFASVNGRGGHDDPLDLHRGPIANFDVIAIGEPVQECGANDRVILDGHKAAALFYPRINDEFTWFALKLAEHDIGRKGNTWQHRRHMQVDESCQLFAVTTTKLLDRYGHGWPPKETKWLKPLPVRYIKTLRQMTLCI